MDIKVPQVRGDDLGPAVVEQLPEFAAYLLSGFTVGLQRLNLTLLLFVALIGYAAHMIAFYGDRVLGVVTYAPILGLIGVANTSMWICAGYRGSRTTSNPSFWRMPGPAWR